jgi:hypothetical protein
MAQNNYAFAASARGKPSTATTATTAIIGVTSRTCCC